MFNATLFYGSGGESLQFYPKQIEYSCLFDNDDGSHMTRDVLNPSDRRTWTLSLWIKRCDVTRIQSIFSAIQNDVDNGFDFRFTATDTLEVEYEDAGNIYTIETTKKYLDFTSWYHLVLRVDTTASTPSDRMRIYVNGELAELTDASDLPALNYQTEINNTTLPQVFGKHSDSVTQYLHAYLSEVVLLDGTSAAPTDFGLLRHGIWIPKRTPLSGHGTNGFHLEFKDEDNLGEDSSEENNNYSTSGIDENSSKVKDTPTRNTCIMGALPQRVPFSRDDFGGYPILSNGNRTVTFSSSGQNSSGGAQVANTTMAANKGKWYYEFTPTSISGSTVYKHMGVQSTSGAVRGYWRGDGLGAATGASNITLPSWTTGVTHAVAFDADEGVMTYYKAGSLVGTQTILGWTNNELLTPWVYNSYSPGGTWVADVIFDEEHFTYALPNGFHAWNNSHQALPEIPSYQGVEGEDYYSAVTYTGTGEDYSNNQFDFKPDLLWFKNRSTASTDWRLYDAQRGTAKLSTNLSDNEQNDGSSFDSFDANGFSIPGTSTLNTNTQDYAAWGWKAGDSGVANTNGSITSNVNVNRDTGFSIVTYTGTGANATVGHGLGKAPAFMMVKNRDDDGTNWAVYHKNMAGGDAGNAGPYALFMNSSAQRTASNTYWQDQEPTSGFFRIGSHDDVNKLGSDYIAYCWTGIDGFSDFGYYQGTGGRGELVLTNFRPTFVLVKYAYFTGSGSYDAGNQSWYLFDTSRDEGNTASNAILYPDLQNAEATGSGWLNWYSSGFQFQTNSGAVNYRISSSNSSNYTQNYYIYAAFGDHPAKYAPAR